MKTIVVKSFNGIGDLLFATPALRVIKEAYPNSRIVFNTNKGELLLNNPFVDEIGRRDEGVFLEYPDPARCGHSKRPTQHHMITDWELICAAYKLETARPRCIPELYVTPLHTKRDAIGVQVIHKDYYHKKRIWPHLDRLSTERPFEPIPQITGPGALLKFIHKISEYRCLVTAEGGVTSVATALGIPCIVIYGGFMNPAWNGYDVNINITSNVDCMYCYNLFPCENDYQCWDDIPYELVKGIALATFGENEK